MSSRPRPPVREGIMGTGTTRRAFLRALTVGSAGSAWAARLAHAAGPNIVAGSFAGVWGDGLKAGGIPCYKRKTGGGGRPRGGPPTRFLAKGLGARGPPAVGPR